jgi:hypothetical protein
MRSDNVWRELDQFNVRPFDVTHRNSHLVHRYEQNRSYGPHAVNVDLTIGVVTQKEWQHDAARDDW